MLQDEDAILYSDDTNLILYNNEEQTRKITRLNNYAKVTTSRQLKINWVEVLLLTRKTKGNPHRALPHPYKEMQTNNIGTVLGKKIHIQGHQKHAIRHRLTKAKKTWGTAGKTSPKQEHP